MIKVQGDHWEFVNKPLFQKYNKYSLMMNAEWFQSPLNIFWKVQAVFVHVVELDQDYNGDQITS